MSSFFEKATNVPGRLKMYIYGETGTGKTITALQFPKPAVIDTEKGTVHYADKIGAFDVTYTNSFMKVAEIVDSLLQDPQGYKTLVIDPFSNVYDDLINQVESHQRKKRGKPDYELKGLDYRPIKNQTKILALNMVDLDMNIVMTARSKALYDNTPGEFMKMIGTGPEGHDVFKHHVPLGPFQSFS